jgi:radical SAM superfamily enzyme YgiQ (UPF0313 family)
MDSIDILIVNVPGTVRYAPLAAPALLKASVESHGFIAKTVDYNLDFWLQNHNKNIFPDLENFFINVNHTSEMRDIAKELVIDWVNDIKTYNPRFVGISVFTYQSRVSTELFCAEIRKQLPNTKIILGGQGIPDGGINGGTEWVSRQKSLNLFDYWVRSEGEDALIDILNDKYKDPMFYGFEQIKDLDSIPIPDYSDYQFDKYQQQQLLVTGSRGCVRHCSFCDIHTHWKKFVWRDGEKVAEEMIKQSQKYGINQFIFTDSLVNGNTRQFSRFVSALAEYNVSNPDQKIFWRGQFIIRRKQKYDDTIWELTGLSGADRLAIGIESGSEKVRKHLGKEFSNDDIDYVLDEMAKHNITSSFLMLVGYPTETESDFQDTIDMFERNKDHAGKEIANVTLGTTLAVLPNTPLYNNADDIGLVLDPRSENYWVNTNNPDLTFKERIRRRLHLDKLLPSLGYKLSEDRDVYSLMQMWNNYNEN